MQYFIKNPARVSTLMIDANFDIGATYAFVDLATINCSSAAGTTVLASSDAEIDTAGDAAYTMYKEIHVPTSMAGANNQFTIDFDLKSKFGGNLVYGRIYKNGAPAGTEQSTASSSYVTMSESLAGFSAGDHIQLYCCNKSSGGTPSIRNLRIKGTLTGYAEGRNPTWS